MLHQVWKFIGLVIGLLCSCSLAYALDKPAFAIPVAENTPHQDFLTEAGQSKWYVINSTAAAKLTFKLDNAKLVNANYDLRVYRLDAAGNTLVEEVASVLPDGMSEQVSKMAAAGALWYVQVSSASGFDSANPFSLSWNSSSGADPQEPDDSPAQAKILPYVQGTSNRKQGTHDNPNDLDWYQYTIPVSGLFNIMVHQGWDAAGKPLPTASPVAELYDKDFRLLTTFLTFKPISNYSLPAGKYYFKLYSATRASGFSYAFSVFPKVPPVPPVVTRVTIDTVTSEGGVQGFINYGQGSKWRVKGAIGIYGKALDANGVALANAAVSVAVRPIQSQNSITASATSDAAGNFVLNLTLPPAAGYSIFNNVISWHYYDVIPVSFTSNGSTVPANIVDFYHYAYQVPR